MRILVAAVAAVLLSVPAYSQNLTGGKMHHDKKAAQPKKPKADDKAYNAALSRIPDKKVDPWQGAR